MRRLYDLLKQLHDYRGGVPKFERHGLWRRCEECALDLLADILKASQLPKSGKAPYLRQASFSLSLLRLLLRLAWDTRCIDNKKTAALQTVIDEIGRMIGGWMKSLQCQNGTPPPPTP